MPKSKKKKNTKRSAKKISTQSSSTNEQGGEQSSESARGKTRGWKASLLDTLYQNEAEGLRRLIRFLPLFTGAWLVGGMLLANVWQFITVSALALLSYFAAHPEKRKQAPFAELIDMLLYAAVLGLLCFLYLISNSPAFTLLTGAVLVLIWLSEKLVLESVFAVLLLSAERIVEMSLLSLLSVYSQLELGTIAFHWEYCILGFVPACSLAAAYIARYSYVFLNAGWQRSKEVEHPKKGRIVRPAGLSQLFSLLLLLGPALPVALSPLGLFPASFLLIAFAFFPIPKLCQSFLEGSMADVVVFFSSLRIAAMLSGLVFLAALMARVIA